ncbi:MAG TPA: hypothetical protein PKC89_12810 [Pyrinomonadaceae bacterium]|nr:hypothetical protein [Pyrinomonadaceae bacterium]
MKFLVLIFFVATLPVLSLAQSVTREQKLKQITDLIAQIRAIEVQLLAPSPQDLSQAKAEGFEVFRLMPRETFGRVLLHQGGGAFYSFTSSSNDYQKGAQIEFQQNHLSVGFGGADYGFLFDLGSIPLNYVDREIPVVAFLVSYRAPKKISEVRKEQRKAFNYETDAGTLNDRIPAIVGHTYILRSINFDRADILVALKIIRKDTDGSLICFWQKIETFETPIIIRDKSED